MDETAIVAKLRGLAESWDVEIESDGPEHWTLTLKGCTRDGGRERHLYRGLLVTVVSRAYAGEKGD